MPLLHVPRRPAGPSSRLSPGGTVPGVAHVSPTTGRVISVAAVVNRVAPTRRRAGCDGQDLPGSCR